MKYGGVVHGEVSHLFLGDRVMNILCTDLDNTIIYSYKHNIGKEKINVEIYQGREISFITKKTYNLLERLKKEYVIVPTTTRTIEQYKRIDLGIGEFTYALVCNGGVLLINGERDNEWYEASLQLVNESNSELEKAMSLLTGDARRKFELRFIEKLFVFTKCNDPYEVVQNLKTQLETELVDVFNNGEKVYVVPKKLSKGIAINRLREKLHPEYIIAAGDSEFDVSMVEEADYGIVPHGFTYMYNCKKNLLEMEEDTIFSEALSEKVLTIKAELN